VPRAEEIEFVSWSERTRRPDARCLFTGSASLHDAIAARLIAATAARLPDVVFDLAGPVTRMLGPVPENVRLHPGVEVDLFRQALLGLSPTVVPAGGNDRVVEFVRAGLPVIASPLASRGFEPALAACWLVCSPEPYRLRDAIVESLDWDWSGPVAEARRLVSERYERGPAQAAFSRASAKA
jgi:hypothetical protein